MRLLVVGSRGFLGSAVARFAHANGHEVFGLSRSAQPSRDWVGTHMQCDAAAQDMAPFIELASPDVLFHAAGTASVQDSLSRPLDDLRASALTFANLLDGVRRSTRRPVIVFPSSAAVYGDPKSLPVAEDAPAVPLSPYGHHKICAEVLADEFSRCFGLTIVVARLFSVYGPLQRRLLIWELYRQLVTDGDIVRLQGTGEETRDYLHQEDVAHAVLSLATMAEHIEGRCLKVNVASGTESRVLDIATTLKTLTGSSKSIVCGQSARPGDPLRWRADVSRIRAQLPSFQPRALEPGLRECVSVWERERNVRG